MPTRRRFLQTCCALVGLGTVSGSATASERRFDDGSLPAPARAAPAGDDADALLALGDRTFGRLDFETLRAVRDRAAGRDAAVGAGDETLRQSLDDRLAPVLGRSRDGDDAPAGVGALGETLDASDVLDRLREMDGFERRDGDGDGGVFDAGAEGGATLEVDGDVLYAAVSDAGTDDGAGAGVRPLTEEPQSAGSPARRAVDGLRAADAVTATTFGDDPARAVDDEALTPVLSGLDALGLAVEVTEDRDAATVRARLVYGDADAADPAPVRSLVGAVAESEPSAEAFGVRDDGDVLAVTGRLPVASPLSALFLLLLLALAAVVGSFVLGLGTQNEPRAPQVSFGFETTGDGRVTITHEGGDELGVDGRVLVQYTHDGASVTDYWRSRSITAGDEFTTSQSVDPGTDVEVVWQGEASVVLASYQVPN